jgi:hypothetical protein
MRGGSRMERATINKQQFVEVQGSMKGGSVAEDARIGSQRQGLDIKAWDPADNDEEVLHSQSVKVNIEALNSEEHEVLYDEGADWNTGTHNNTEAIGTELNLTTSPYTEDWEGVSPLDNWTNRLTTGNWSIIDDGTGNKVARCYVYNDQSLISPDDGPNTSDQYVVARFQSKEDWDAKFVLATRLTGSGSALRGYGIQLRDDGYMTFGRWTGDGSMYGIRGEASGLGTILIDTWYWLAFRTAGSGHYYKAWKDGDAEPGSWDWIGTDSTHSGPGYVGIGAFHSTANEFIWIDDVKAESIPASYQSSGDWESGIIDLAAVETYSHGIVTWDETLPTNTTLAVKVRWPGGSWSALTNGAILPGITYERDMGPGSTHGEFELRCELATTDSAATPAIENLSVYFEPCRQEELELIVDGVSCVPDDNSLLNWGRGWVGASGVPPTLEADWSDLWAETSTWWLSRDLEVVAATLKYWANTIEAISFAAEGSKYRHGYLRSYFSIPITPFYTGPNHWTWTALTEWNPFGKVYEWVLTDKGMAIHADAKWIVGHPQRDDHPLSFLVSVPNVHDHPLSVLAKAYARDDHALSMLIQGWQRDDHPLALLVGEWTINDQPVSMLVALEYLNDHPLSVVVYGVSKEGMIEINIIDDDTWAELVALGFTRS